MDLQSRIDHARHPCGANFRIYSEPPVPTPDLERVRTPPSVQDVGQALMKAGCPERWVTERWVQGFHRDGYTIHAQRSAGGWLLTGGPHNLLNYGAPDADALERFPDVLASIQEHARYLDRRATR